MRRLLLLTALIPATALAEPVDTQSRIAAVTLFPYGALVTRDVAADLPAGRHELRVTDLPTAVLDNPGLLRVLAGPGLAVESVMLTTDPGLTQPPTAAQTAARAEVARRLAALQAAATEVARLEATVVAATARQGFLQSLGQGADLQAATAAQLAEIATLVGDGVAAAAAAQVEAEVALIAARATRDQAQAALDTARANPDAGPSDIGGAVLALTVTAGADAGALQLTYLTEDAGWQPVYDLRLTQGPTPALVVDRGVSVSQSTGEDWGDVTLTLSTADLYAQTTPGTLWPELRRVLTAEEIDAWRKGYASDGLPGMAEPAMVADAIVAESAAPELTMQGDTVTYVYPTPADVPTGAASLRLSLGQLDLPVTLQALAVPRLDETAFLMAEVTNDAAEVLLPGEAALYRDGALVGGATLQRLVPGQTADIAFGAIDGLRLRRDMPVRETGDGGFLTGATEQTETAVLQVENLTSRAWEVRLLDQIPYSEQTNLQIAYTADLPVTETDVDGQRGILAWDFSLPAGTTRAVTLTTTLSWPEGEVLQ